MTWEVAPEDLLLDVALEPGDEGDGDDQGGDADGDARRRRSG